MHLIFRHLKHVQRIVTWKNGLYVKFHIFYVVLNIFQDLLVADEPLLHKKHSQLGKNTKIQWNCRIY